MALQITLCRQVDQASSIGELNARGQGAFDVLNEFGESIDPQSLNIDELEFLNLCMDDVRMIVRSRAELQMLVIEGKAPTEAV